MHQLLSLKILAVVALAVCFGGMTFFSLVLAPLVFRKLPPQTAGAFIREVFPWYYLTMGTTTLVALLLLLPGISDGQGWSPLFSAIALGGFVFARQVLMPMINRARDAKLTGDEQAGQRFKRLHALSVVLNAGQWLAVLAALVLLVP
jgi:hypothetical protein